MEALREVVKSATRDFHLTLPDWAIGHEVEVIVLPFEKAPTNIQEAHSSLIDRLLADPIEAVGFKPLSREQAHAR